jgi:ABC-2 type transport system permease protein
MISRMQYKLDTFLLVLAVIMRESVTVITLYFILLKFSVIQGWNLDQLFFLYSFVFLTYSICILVFTGIRDFEGIVNQGEFDSYLTKPINPLFQVLARKSDVMATLAHGTLGLILFFFAVQRTGITFDFSKIILIFFFLAGGILIQGALLLIPAALTFWTTKSGEIQNLIFYQMRGFIAYPISIYPKVIQYLLTFVIPLAFVNYYPAQYFFDDKHAVSKLLAFASPLVGIGIFLIALFLWKKGLDHYKSTGN